MKKKDGVKTNCRLEFGKQKNGFERNGVLGFIGKKMWVGTNNGLEFGKKRWVFEQRCVRFDRRRKKKDGGYDEQWIRIW